MATITWVVFKHHRKADGTYNPKIRVYHNGSTAYIPTQIYTPLVRFKRGNTMGTITDGAIQDVLNDRVKEYRQLLNTCCYMDNFETAREVVDFLNRKLEQQGDLDFIVFLKDLLASVPANGSRNVYQFLLSNLVAYVGEKLPVRKITPAFLRGFEGWMLSDHQIIGQQKKRKPLARSSVKTLLERMQTTLNKMKERYNDYALGDIAIPGDPFKAYKFAGEDIVFKKRAVSAEVIRAIAEYIPGKARGRSAAVLARDMFLLSFGLAGMNMVDLMTCTDYVDGRINYQRTKTRAHKRGGSFISVPVMPEVRPLFDKYRDPSRKRVFRIYQFFSNNNCLRSTIATGMRTMCKDLGIEPVTFYAARHSFATIARNDCNVPMDDIALCLTHRSAFNMTDTYVKPDFSRVDHVIRLVLDYVYGPKKQKEPKRVMMKVVEI